MFINSYMNGMLLQNRTILSKNSSSSSKKVSFKYQSTMLEATESALEERKRQKKVYLAETHRTNLESHHEAEQKVITNS